MKAARFYGANEPLKIEDVPQPQPGPGEVLLAVKAAGLCGTDLHIAVEGTILTATRPITLGHEAAGVVAEAGTGVTNWKAGDRAAAFPNIACGECYACASGREALCLKSRILGVQADGAFAEYLLVPARTLVRLPDSIPFEVGAILTDAVSTAYHAVACRGNVLPSEAVVVIGCGGVGHHGVLWAKQRGAAPIIAVDVSAGARRRAREAGADHALDPAEADVAKSVRALTGGAGADCALEFVGRADTVTTAMKCLKRGGRAVVVGVGPERVALPPLQAFVGSELALVTSLGFHRVDLEKIIGLVAAGEVDVSHSVTEIVSLEQINEALQRLAERKGDPVRVVVRVGEWSPQASATKATRA
ncbi:MAG: zinc-binding dehydrogenase [Chloroflexi bacterium]|nr:zinc-binding dehydrogenase [Chloroflexota bacterium]